MTTTQPRLVFLRDAKQPGSPATIYLERKKVGTVRRVGLDWWFEATIDGVTVETPDPVTAVKLAWVRSRPVK